MSNIFMVGWAETATKEGFTVLCVCVHACVCMCVCMWMSVCPQCYMCVHALYCRRIARSNRALAGNKLGTELSYQSSTFVPVSLASLRTRYTLFTLSWSTMDGSMKNHKMSMIHYVRKYVNQHFGSIIKMNIKANPNATNSEMDSKTILKSETKTDCCQGK